MRSVPDRPSVAEENRLRRFVADPEPNRQFIGDLPMALDGDQFVGGAGGSFGNVGVQLIESLTADAASTAVLEQKNRAFAGFIDGLVEPGNV